MGEARFIEDGGAVVVLNDECRNHVRDLTLVKIYALSVIVDTLDG